MKWARHVARLGEMRNAYIILLHESHEKKSLGRPKNKGEDNIRLVLKEMR
jgi:hypothetical protein